MKIKYRLLFSLRAILSTAIISTGLAGCTSLPYLHSNETEIATQGAKDAAGNIKVDQNFADTKKQLASFATREDQAVADYLIASRDRQLASLVRNDVLEKSGGTAIDRLQIFVNGRFKKIIGKKPDNDLLSKLRDFPKKLSLIRVEWDLNHSFYDSALRDFTDEKDQADVLPTDCSNAVLKPPSELPTVSVADIAYIRLVKACIGISDAEKKENEAHIILSPSNGSALSNVFNETDKALTEIKKEEDEAAKIEHLIDEIERLSKPDQSAQKELTEKITEAQTRLKEAKGFAKFAGAKRLSKSLEEILTANLETTSTNDSKTTQKTAAILKLTDSLALASDAFQDEPQINRVNSVLIAITEQRQKRDVALLNISSQKDLLRIYEAKQTALIQELAQLSITQRILNDEQKKISLNGDGGGFAVIPPGAKKPGPVVGSMLAAYAASWNQGQIPYQILRFKEVQVKRAYHAEVAAKTAQNRKDLLAPALDELAAYGKGGVHPETIATLITNIGLIAAFAAR